MHYLYDAIHTNRQNSIEHDVKYQATAFYTKKERDARLALLYKLQYNRARPLSRHEVLVMQGNRDYIGTVVNVAVDNRYTGVYVLSTNSIGNLLGLKAGTVYTYSEYQRKFQP